MDSPKISLLEDDLFDLTNERVTINVGGFRHNTFLATLKAIPDTRLSWMAENHPNCPEYDQVLGEYFFDRHPRIFSEVLNYYRTGKLHCPVDVCSKSFQDELAYWGITDRDLEPCCWVHYKRQLSTEETLKSFHIENARKIDAREKRIGRKLNLFGSDVQLGQGLKQRWLQCRPKVWSFLDDPHSSKASWVFVLLCCLFVIVSVTQFCLATVPSIKQDKSAMRILRLLDTITSVWFTIEFVLRLVFCPKFSAFIKNPMNWIDFMAIIPFYFRLIHLEQQISWLILMRTLRIFKVFSLSFSFQILFRSLISSKNELFLVLVSLLVPIILFSSMIHFVEKDHNENFQSIPESFWWAIITVTTVGYGDVCPITKLGKVIGAMCAICGVVIVALPVSVIGGNFSYYYIQARTRVQQPKRSNHEPPITRVPAHIMHRHFMSRRSTSVSVNGSSIHGRNSLGRTRKVNGGPPLRKRARRRPTQYQEGSSISMTETVEQESQI